MAQKCPLCGKTINPAYEADPDSVAGKYYFCRGSPGCCRATFMVHPENNWAGHGYARKQRINASPGQI